MMETPEQNRNVFAVKKFLSEYLDLRKDKDNELETVDSIRKGVEFKGANLWILIFAIFMASLGLNVNSTAVIIGAMLISPLMGPIMGVGLSVGLNDFELMKRSLKSFLITTLFSVTTATVFFLVSPTGPPLNLSIMVQSILLSISSRPYLSMFSASKAKLAISVSMLPEPFTCAKSRTRRNNAFAIRGVPRLREAISDAALVEQGTFRIPAERRMIPLSTSSS